jgi:hypothetical protein
MPHRALDELQQESFSYFLHETNRGNGLVRDKTRKGWPASITAVGMALAAYTVGVERGFLTRTEAAHRTLATLRFFWRSPQGPQPDATGHKGFYYHSWTWRPAGVRSAPNCPRSIPPSFSPEP